MSEHEVFQRAPLRLVSLEIRFPLTSRVLTRPVWDALEEALATGLPEADVLADAPDTTIPRESHQAVLRRTSQDHRRAVTLYTDSVTIEVADYLRYQDLRDLAESTITVLADIPAFMQTRRMGLRYINEISAALVHSADQVWQEIDSWTDYVNPNLLGGVKEGPDKLCAYANHAVALFHSPEGTENVSLDYGIQPEGTVEPDGVLMLGEPSGPCFVLDIDAQHYHPPQDGPPATRELLDTLDKLHDIVERIFDWSVTDSAREIFRGSDPEGIDESPVSDTDKRRALSST